MKFVIDHEEIEEIYHDRIQEEEMDGFYFDFDPALRQNRAYDYKFKVRTIEIESLEELMEMFKNYLFDISVVRATDIPYYLYVKPDDIKSCHLYTDLLGIVYSLDNSGAKSETNIKG